MPPQPRIHTGAQTLNRVDTGHRVIPTAATAQCRTEGPAPRVRRLAAGYAGGPVLHGVDLNEPDAAVVAMQGCNGAGKSTPASRVCAAAGV